MHVLGEPSAFPKLFTVLFPYPKMACPLVQMKDRSRAPASSCEHDSPNVQQGEGKRRLLPKWISMKNVKETTTVSG